MMILPVIDSNVLVGLPAIERAVESWRKSWGTWRFDIDELIDAGDHVVVIGHQRAEGKESGAEVELFELRRLDPAELEGGSCGVLREQGRGT